MINFDELLKEKINITPEMENQANSIYNELSIFLSQELKIYSPDIFPQGSFKLGTIIRPLSNKDEFDLDFVCLLNSIQKITQEELYDLLGNTLHKKYTEQKLEGKNRCWRVNFENFHVDILPAISKAKSQSENFQALLIPDKKREEWQQTNPKGYAAWFKEKAQLRAPKEIALESIQPLPIQNNDLPLQKIVKLMKYHRDVTFSSDIKNKPISMIVTTLAAMSYDGTQDLTDALSVIINNIKKIAPQIIEEQSLPNPVNQNENFADAWKDHPKCKENFKIWVEKLDSLINDYVCVQNDESKCAKLFLEHFGYTGKITSQKQITTTLPIYNPTHQWYK